MTLFRRRLAAWAALTPALCLALGGCAPLSRLAHRLAPGPAAAELSVKPVLTATAPVAASVPADRLYRQAVQAIETRRYADALDLLQYARQAAPDDPRMLNALGVVYDKLGRFDLSARYYALALQRDPGSAAVASNTAYSQVLQARNRADVQRRDADPIVAERLLAAPTPPPAPFTLAASTVTPRRGEAMLAGHAMLVVNATGRSLGHEPTRRYLASAGWSVRAADGAPRASSEIVYAAKFRPIALALARTLPFPARLTDCSDACVGVLLVLGRDTPKTLRRLNWERSL